MTRIVALPALLLALLVLPVCGGNDGTVTGKVYFEGGNVELPEGAVVTVKLLDISYADAPSMTLGEHVIKGAGSLPVKFRIPLRQGSAIDDRNDYSLSAQNRARRPPPLHQRHRLPRHHPQQPRRP